MQDDFDADYFGVFLAAAMVPLLSFFLSFFFCTVLNNQLGDFFKTTVYVCQVCLLSPFLFNLFLEEIMKETLHTMYPSPLVAGPYATCNLLATSILRAAAMTNFKIVPTDSHRQSNRVWNESQHRKEQDHDQQHKWHWCRYELKQTNVRRGDQFQVPGSIPVQGWHLVSRNSHWDHLSNGQLRMIWQSNTISFTSKFKLRKSLVISILLYGCEIWTLFADSEKRIQAFDTKCLRELLRISDLERKTKFQQLSTEQHQPPCGPTGISSGSRQEV